MLWKNFISEIGKILPGKERAIELTIITLLAKGHLLIEDLPGIGKTTLALVVARSLGLSFGRIQGTPDLLPSDILGGSIYVKEKGSFVFQPGPVFNNVVLFDEINRASGKTQSALLEPMEEGQATIDGITHKLPQPFFVIATQNPIEYLGTFPLPEALLDRFLMKISLGYPPRHLELEILKRGSLREDIPKIEKLIDKENLQAEQEKVKAVYVSEKVLNYLLDIAEATRKSPYLIAGLSTRALLSLMLAAKARAVIYARDYVIPEDIKELAPYTIPHRLIFKEEYSSQGLAIVKETLENIPLPL
jgi:MoxR-like ATPase